MIGAAEGVAGARGNGGGERRQAVGAVAEAQAVGARRSCA